MSLSSLLRFAFEVAASASFFSISMRDWVLPVSGTTYSARIRASVFRGIDASKPTPEKHPVYRWKTANKSGVSCRFADGLYKSCQQYSGGGSHGGLVAFLT